MIYVKMSKELQDYMNGHRNDMPFSSKIPLHLLREIEDIHKKYVDREIYETSFLSFPIWTPVRVSDHSDLSDIPNMKIRFKADIIPDFSDEMVVVKQFYTKKEYEALVEQVRVRVTPVITPCPKCGYPKAVGHTCDNCKTN